MFLLWVLINFLGFAMCVTHTMMRAIVFAFFINGTEFPAFAGCPTGGCCVGGRWHSLHRFTRLRKLNIVFVDNVRPVGRQPRRVEWRPYRLCFVDAFSATTQCPTLALSARWRGQGIHRYHA
jgi:hypothetical protein